MRKAYLMARSTQGLHEDIVKWMCDNVNKFEDRLIFFDDCILKWKCSLRTVERIYKNIFKPKKNLISLHIIEDNRKLADTDTVSTVSTEDIADSRQKQRKLDTERIERKINREAARVENAVESLGLELKTLLQTKKFSTLSVLHPDRPSDKAAGIVHLTDLHLNELVNIIGNKYDFKVASQRLARFVEITTKHFKAEGITQVLVAFTGDILNSDRRLDELLSQATNRAKAVFLASDLLQQVLMDLNQNFNLTVVSVSGNESRMPKDIGWTNDTLTDNYDFLVHNILKTIFSAKGNNGIIFLDGSFGETVVSVAGQNIIVTHGMNLKTDTEKEVARMMGRYAAKGITVSYILYGHLHSARLGDIYGRGSSLVGANAYSEDGLNLIGRASQNIFIVRTDGNIDGMKISLQNVDKIKGYSFDPTLEAYNIKSADKCHKPEVIFEVVI